eukprot:14744226-Ditylum_brightwellii.AAC.1
MRKSNSGKGNTQEDTTEIGQVYMMVKDHPLDAMWTKGECYAMMDLGGELGKHPEVQLLLQQHRYNIRPTAPDASYQNAPGE